MVNYKWPLNFYTAAANISHSAHILVSKRSHGTKAKFKQAEKNNTQ